ncbi:MAG: CBS domain-containing protein, partial [Peptococcaceae bacterium]|nr:CBS domain-containing protein [Peptococcaceae bacterium]
MTEKNDMNKKISTIMKTDVYTVSDEASLKEVLEVLVKYKTSGLPIVNKENRVVGFISDGDIMKFIAKQNPRIIDMTSFITVWYDTDSFEQKLHDLMDLNVMELATTKLVYVESDYDID